MPEYEGELGKKFAFDVITFFRHLGNFKEYETAYDGPGTAAVFYGEREVRFDVFIREEVRNGGKKHHYCECKFRSSAEEGSSVKSEFKAFLGKAVDVLEYCMRKYGAAGFDFMFVSSVPFGIWESDVKSVERLRELLEGHEVNDADLTILSSHLRLLILPKWLIDTVIMQGEGE